MPNKKAAPRPRPATTVSASQFKATCLELMDDIAETGAEIVVTKHGRPVVRVGPAVASPTSPPGFLRGTVVRHGDIVSADPDAWEQATDPRHRARVRRP